MAVGELLQHFTGLLCVQVSLLQALAGGPVPVQALGGRPLQVGLGGGVLDMPACFARRLSMVGRGAAVLHAAVAQG